MTVDPRISDRHEDTIKHVCGPKRGYGGDVDLITGASL